ncbi:MAG: hypothetical protein H6810_07875 [Phycisphaeraceae bacterium]|nr:MAG: hypothetical protein H6810_07875 [Phycisphaeraceae bacterium]
MRPRTSITVLVLVSMWIGVAPLFASGTAFTYQGVLTNGGTPAGGDHAMTFGLYSAASGGTLLGTQTAAVPVVDGVFSVELDFGAASWNNSDRWIEITVEGFTLGPRQLVTRSPYAITTRGINVSDDGKVGIGTSSPDEKLTVSGTNANIMLRSGPFDSFGPQLIFRNTVVDSQTVHGTLVFDDGSPLASISYMKPSFAPDGLAFTGASGMQMKIVDDGRVGIASLDPQALLHIDGSASSFIGFHMQAPGAATGSITMSSPRSHTAIAANANNGYRRDIWFMDEGLGLFTRASTESPYPANGLFINDSGDVGIGTIEPVEKLHVVGDALIDGTAQVDILQIVGADLAERFPTSDGEIEPGTVVEIDPEHPGQLRVASSPRSTLVAGVVSGANGLSAGTIMGNLPGSENHVPVALSGRVWVKCDASTRGIRPGDMLTTSSTPGHAMAVGDPAGAQGAILGKAMTGLGMGERGQVLVLVNLQ